MGEEFNISKYTQEYTNYLVKYAHENLLKGIIEEPRVFFDEIAIGNYPIQNFSGSDIFKNGERFPIRLTHLTLGPVFSLDEGADPPAPFPEQVIQRMGVQFRFHDQWYMNPNFVAAPNWSNIPTATPPGVNETTASWRFIRPVILGTRDTMEIQVGLLIPPPPQTAVPVSVTFVGLGIESKRPYFFNGQIGLFDTALRSIPTANFRNDGAEPVMLTDLVVNTGGATGADVAVGIGNIRNVRIQIKQVGNGTNARWMIGPVTPGPQAVCASNLGILTGRCIVHEFPGDGLLWEPGEGIDIAVQALDQAEGLATSKLSIALAGYISIQ
jgi:hypothetical protein